MHSREENRTHVGKKKTKHAHCRPKYTWLLEDCEQKQLLTHYGVESKTTMNTMRTNNTRTMDPKAEANTFKRIYPVTRRSTRFQNASARTRRRHVYGFDYVPTSPDRTLGNAETPRENKIYAIIAMENVRLWCI
jgi:hypothetical protein